MSFVSIGKSVKKKSPFFIAMVIVFAVFIASMAATTYIVYKFNYNIPLLGQPLFANIYQPFSWVTWIAKYNNELSSPYVITTLKNSTLLFLFVFFVCLIIPLSFKTNKKVQKYENLHGSAHWATYEEVKQTGLLNNNHGVYCGGWENPNTKKIEYLRHSGAEHILVWAPTRSGKGVVLILATLLSWRESVFIYDLKGENWALTSGWRKSIGQKVLKFEPAAEYGSVQFNPLDEISRDGKKAVSQAQNIALMLTDPEGKGLNDHWEKSAYAFLPGVILHLIFSDYEEKNLPGLLSFLSNPNSDIEDTLMEMINTQHSCDIAGKIIKETAASMLNKASQERSGIISTVLTFLDLYRDPIIAENMRSSQFKISDLMNHHHPVSLYLVAGGKDKDRLRPLIRLMINQIVTTLTKDMAFEDGRSTQGYKHKLLLMLDEFPALRKLSIIESALAYMAGYGIKAYIIAQDRAQIKSVYSQNETITAGCHVRMAFAPNTYEGGKDLSNILGTTTIYKDAYTTSGKRGKNDNLSHAINETSRPLLTPDECMRLPAAKKEGDNIIEAGDMLILVAGHAPIYGKQTLYFRDPIFSKRSKIPAPPVSDILLYKYNFNKDAKNTSNDNENENAEAE